MKSDQNRLRGFIVSAAARRQGHRLQQAVGYQYPTIWWRLGVPVRILRKHALLVGLLIIFPANAFSQDVPPASQDAPPAVRGKSVIITWTEYRSQRQAGQAAFRDIVDPLSQTIYFSTEGRPFLRFASTSRGRQASSDGIGMSGTSFGGGPRQIQFTGRTFILIGTSKGGVGRRFTVGFNDTFSTCTAQVVFAKEAGADVVMGRNLYTGKSMEIRSSTVSGVSCSVRDGNVFAGP